MAPRALALTLVPQPDDKPAPVTLDSFGDVLTDADLAQLVRKPPRWAVQRRWEAKRRGVAPDLPDCISDVPGRYHRDAVAAWLRGRGVRRR